MCKQVENRNPLHRWDRIWWVAAIIIICCNSLLKSTQVDDEDIRTATTGDILGYGSILPNNRSLHDVRAQTDVYVAFIPRKTVYSITARYHNTMFLMAERVLRSMPQLLSYVDLCVDSHSFQAGDLVYKDCDQRQV